jgi:hypothetical protein
LTDRRRFEIFAAAPERTSKRAIEMKFQLTTHLTPEDVIQKAEQYYGEHTGLDLQERGENRLKYTGAIGVAEFSAYCDHGHTTVQVETDRGVGFDVTDQALRFLYSIPHI